LRRARKALLVLAAVELALLLTLHAPGDPEHPGVAGGLRTAAAQLRGEGPRIDLVQDYVGARRLVGSGDPYLRLDQAFAEVGISSKARHRSTHPPSAFVLALSIAGFSWKVGAAVWAALMLAAIGGAWWALGAAPELAAALAPLTLAWPPAAWSLGQLTPLWLLGLALAWRWRERPLLAGAGVAFASLTKLLAALSLAPLLAVRRWRALVGFGAVWSASLALLLLLRTDALERYLHVIRSTGDDQAARQENAALLWAAGHNFGVGGVVAGGLLVLGVLLTAVKTGGEWSWWAWCWGGVALLPIAWIYSLLPLLPVMAFCVRRGGLTSRALVLVALVIPLLIDPFGLPGAIRLAAATACIGVALLVVAYASLLRRAYARLSV
jgi:Glycosyltransferase family 87